MVLRVMQREHTRLQAVQKWMNVQAGHDQNKFLHVEIFASKCDALEPEFCNYGNSANISKTAPRR